MSQEALAKAVGYESTHSRSTISKIEKGEHDITQSMLKKFAEVLGVSPTYLLGVDETHQQFDEVYDTETIQVEVKVFDAVQQAFGKTACELLQLFIGLNDLGKSKALESLEDLSAIDKYIK